MNKIYSFFSELFGKKLSEEQQEEERRNAEVKYHLYPENGVSVIEFLKKHGKKLWFRRSFKRVPYDYYLICLYRNPYDVSLGLQAGIMYNSDQYEEFLQSMNKKEGWYFVPSSMLRKNSNFFR